MQLVPEVVVVKRWGAQCPHKLILGGNSRPEVIAGVSQGRGLRTHPGPTQAAGSLTLVDPISSLMQTSYKLRVSSNRQQSMLASAFQRNWELLSFNPFSALFLGMKPLQVFVCPYKTALLFLWSRDTCVCLVSFVPSWSIKSPTMGKLRVRKLHVWFELSSPQEQLCVRNSFPTILCSTWGWGPCPSVPHLCLPI